MANILCRTKGNASPKGKPRVYFTCCPEDFDDYFDKICEDIFAAHDCAIFYKEDMSESIDGQDSSTQLVSSNLIVVPVTFRLLTRANPAMDEEIPLAIKNGIPVLPFMMETGIREVYTKRFGARQSLNPHQGSDSPISYEEKLKKFLGSVLVSDTLAKRVRRAFDGYIFLSYRRQDRSHANKLMQFIHSIPECRDVAIWYDEFLTPSESFRRSISRMLKKCRLFTLLVTPELLKDTDGKPNFIVRKEYPAARKAGKPIFPAEMVPTNKAALRKKFEELPACVSFEDTDRFRERLLSAVSGIIKNKNHDAPAHKFLIGIAYLEGIDVESDRERGIELIASAAQDGLPEAMKKLYELYDTTADYRTAGVWAKKLAQHYLERSGPTHRETLEWMDNQSYIFGMLGDYPKAIALQEKVCELAEKAYGEGYEQLPHCWHNLAFLHDAVGENERALELFDKVYALRRSTLGEEHPDTLNSLSQLVKCYCRFGEYRVALEFCEIVYRLRCSTLGEEHEDTLVTMNDMSVILGDLYRFREAVEMSRKAYDLRCRVSGPEHPETLTAMCNLAMALSNLGARDEALALNKKVYDLRCRLSGPEHPQTIVCMCNLAMAHFDLHEYDDAERMMKKTCDTAQRVLGEAHPDTLVAMHNLAGLYERLGQSDKAAELDEKVSALRETAPGSADQSIRRMYAALESIDLSEAPGEDLLVLLRAASGRALCETHPSTLFWLERLAQQSEYEHQLEKEVLLRRKAYEIRRTLWGEESTACQNALNRLIEAYDRQKDYRTALALRQKYYDLKCRISGEECPDDLWALAAAYQNAGQRQKALELYQKLYDINRAILGDNQITLLPLLANLHKELGNGAEALELYQKLDDVNRAILGDDQIDALPLLANLHKELGNGAEALELYGKIYDYWKNHIGEESPGCQNALKDMAECCDLLGDADRAAEYRQKAAFAERVYEAKQQIDALKEAISGYCYMDDPKHATEKRREIYEIQKNVWGEEHQDTLNTLEVLVLEYGYQKEYQEALPLCKRLYELECRQKGTEDPHTLFVLGNLAYICRRVGDFDTAARQYESLHAAQCRVLGEDHTDTLDTLNCLAWTFFDKGDYLTAHRYVTKEYIQRCRVQGKDHPDTALAVRNFKALSRRRNRCQYCAGAFDNKNICTKCGRPKNY